MVGVRVVREPEETRGIPGHAEYGVCHLSGEDASQLVIGHHIIKR